MKYVDLTGHRFETSSGGGGSSSSSTTTPPPTHGIAPPPPPPVPNPPPAPLLPTSGQSGTSSTSGCGTITGTYTSPDTTTITSDGGGSSTPTKNFGLEGPPVPNNLSPVGQTPTNQGPTEAQLESYTMAGCLFLASLAVGACVIISGPAAPLVATAAVGLFAAGVDTAYYSATSGPETTIQGAGEAAQYGFGDALHFMFDNMVP